MSTPLIQPANQDALATPSTASSEPWFGAFLSGLAGWTLDAFDFFVVIFLINTLAARFQVPAAAIIATTAWTLAMRPVGAVIFGMLADRYGRRGPRSEEHTSELQSPA